MRLTREAMIKIARDTASQRARVSRRITCIYLTGSVLSDMPLLGGTTDIDLVFIHDSEPLQPREIIRLSDDVHLDIAHYDQAVFHQPRRLRTDPWLGPFIYAKPMVLHDTQHWFDFTQASTGAQFFQPDNVWMRASTLAQSARSEWMNLQLTPPENHAERVYQYMGVLENAGNALASLIDGPVTERRFLALLPQRLQEFNQPELTGRLIQLFTGEQDQFESGWEQWLQGWKETYTTAARQESAPARMHPSRMGYYERAITALYEDNPKAALWLMIKTWALAASQIPADAAENTIWQALCRTHKLSEEQFSDRLQGLDHYLDLVEETLETWAKNNGVSSIAYL